jgi:putative addiction module component (TIGR02574 family)
MSERTAHVVEEALRLAPAERAQVVEQLLASLDRPDARIDALWAREAEDRITAYDASHMTAMSAKSVFEELEQDV